jgi:hypothetical protein
MWIAYATVAVAVVTFALCIWWLRADEEKLAGDEEATSTPNIVSPEPVETQPTNTPVPRVAAASSAKSDPRVPPARESVTLSSETANAASEPPQSITFHELPIQPYAVNGVIPEPAVRRADASSEGWEKRMQTITVHAEPKECPGCSTSQAGWINLPSACEYFSYTVTQLHRFPAAQIEEHDDFTYYWDSPLSDATGRITGIRISVRAGKDASSPVTPSISMGLTVVVLCPNDLETKGWRDVAE